MAYSLHSILSDVYNSAKSSIRVMFSGGGASEAYSTHTIASAVYNSDESAIRVDAPSFTGAGTEGLVPDPGVENGYYLRDDGAWAAAGGGGGGYSIYVEEADVAVGDNSAADLTLDFDGDDFNLSKTGQEIDIVVNDGGIDHTAIQNIGTNTHAQIDTHIADGTKHFTEASIDHTAIQNIGTNTHAQVDTHIADGTKHFTEASIDHTAIQNIGTNTHAQIDTHVDDTTFHLSAAQKTDLTDAGDSTLHYHATDRARANHTGTQAASTISDFDTEVSNNTDVAANTSSRHDREHAMTGASDHNATANRLFYSDGSGDIKELAFGQNGEYLRGNGLTTVPSWGPLAFSIDLKPAVFTDSVGNQDVLTSAVQVNLDTTVLSNTTYTLSSNTLTLRSLGKYEIEYVFCFTQKDTLGSARGSVEAWMEDDLSGSYVPTPGSYSRDYIRETSYHGSCAGGTIKNFTSANKHVKFYVKKIYTSNPNIKTVADKIMVKVKKVG